jgi:hypothetical protein
MSAAKGFLVTTIILTIIMVGWEFVCRHASEAFYEDGVVATANITGPCDPLRRSPYEFDAGQAHIKASGKDSGIYKHCGFRNGDHVVITYLRSNPPKSLIGEYTEQEFDRELIITGIIVPVVMCLIFIAFRSFPKF